MGDTSMWDRLRTVILMGMIGTATYFTAKLVTDWRNEGRKEKQRIDVKHFSELDAPPIFFLPHTGGCGLLNVSCWATNLYADKPSTVLDCFPAVDILDEEGLCTYFNTTEHCDPVEECLDLQAHYPDWKTRFPDLEGKCALARQSLRFLNQTHLRQLGFSFKSSMDELNLLFSVDTTLCDDFNTSWEAILLMAPTSLDILDLPESQINIRKLGSPQPLGVGGVGQMAFTLEQEIFLDGKVENRTDIRVTQYRPYSGQEGTALTIRVSSYYSRVVQHIPGQSVVDLLGGVFGWWGVLTGACIITFLDWAKALHKRTLALPGTSNDNNSSTSTDKDPASKYESRDAEMQPPYRSMSHTTPSNIYSNTYSI